MENSGLSMAQQIAQAAASFEKQRTGIAPSSVSVALGEETLVITLHGALSEAEKVMSRTPQGAAQLREYHQQLFALSSEPWRKEIRRITGVDVRESAVEIEPRSGALVHAFTDGSIVQVFLLAKPIASATFHAHGEVERKPQA